MLLSGQKELLLKHNSQSVRLLLDARLNRLLQLLFAQKSYHRSHRVPGLVGLAGILLLQHPARQPVAISRGVLAYLFGGLPTVLKFVTLSSAPMDRFHQIAEDFH
jgi:hypothetical protein